MQKVNFDIPIITCLLLMLIRIALLCIGYDSIAHYLFYTIYIVLIGSIFISFFLVVINNRYSQIRFYKILGFLLSIIVLLIGIKINGFDLNSSMNQSIGISLLILLFVIGDSIKISKVGIKYVGWIIKTYILFSFISILSSLRTPSKCIKNNYCL